MRLIARFAQEQELFFEIITVYDKRIIKERLNKENPILISIAENFPAAVWFERKMSDDFGIAIRDSQDERNLVKHEHFPKEVFPLRKNYAKLTTQQEQRLEPPSDNTRICFGPVHPYHLESSSFQLFEKNQTILHFEMRTFFKYRSIEKMLEGLTFDEARPIIERISAPQTVAYQIAFLEIELEAASRKLPEILRKRHLFLLEYERILNHLNDLSLLSQLLEIKEATCFFSNFLEEGREMLKQLTAHRFGFSSISLENNFENIEESYAFLSTLESELRLFDKWMATKEEFFSQLQSIGIIDKKRAIQYGLVGIMARSSGVVLDRRKEDTLLEKNNFYINFEEEGDVFARFNLRVNEIFVSLDIMKNCMKCVIPPLFIGLVQDGEYYSYVESASGELMMYVAVKKGLIERFYLRDPSFLNAQIMPHVLKDNKVHNIGLIVKSIPLDIAAIDL
jgi:Ni,Fe-hydrogenase III large subunit